MNLEDIQGEERSAAIDALSDEIVFDIIGNMIEERGGDPEKFYKYLSYKEGFGLLYEGLLMALPNDYGVITTEGLL